GQDLAHPVPELALDQVRLGLRLLDELPRELDVRLQRRLGLREEFVRFRRLRRPERLDHPRGQRHRALRQGAHVRGRFLRDQHELLDHLVDAFELMQEARPPLEDAPVPVLDFLQDLEHVEREELRLLPDDDRGEERVGRAFDEDLRVAEVEAFHADARARLERVLDEVLHDREHSGEDVLVDLLAELAAVVRDEPSVGMDQEHVLDEIRRLGFDPDLLCVPDLGRRIARFGYLFLMKFWIWMPTETSACLTRMSAIAMSPARSAASACSSEPVASPSSAPRRFAFAIIVETAWTRVSYFSRKV